jgi:rhodanese-related sulfurtransferase
VDPGKTGHQRAERQRPFPLGGARCIFSSRSRGLRRPEHLDPRRIAMSLVPGSTVPLAIALALAVGTAPDGALASPQAIAAATLAEPDPRTPEISTEQLRLVLSARSAVVLDVRPHLEWAIGHIPTALNVAPKPGLPASLYTSDVAEVSRLLGGDRSRALVLYCNGPHCGKSKRVSEDLLAAGYTDVRRYQLGAPVWRALGGVMVTERDGARYVHAGDRTAVWIDARDAAEFAAGTLPGARSLPRSLVLPGKEVGEVKRAKDDGRLPMEDHNTRIVVFGSGPRQAREVAEAIAREAFHNVSYFEGEPQALLDALRVQ